MGCTSSTEARLDCQRRSPPYDRSYSMPVVHGAERKGDNVHVVSLTSTTLGSLELDRSFQFSHEEEMMKATNECNDEEPKAFATVASSDGVRKTTAQSPPAELETETINTWELMEGLEEVSLPRDVDRSFSFNAIRDDNRRCQSEPPPAMLDSSSTSSACSPKPLWMKSAVQLDPDVISIFRKAMNELSPIHPTLRHRFPAKTHETPKLSGLVRKRIAAFQEQIDARKGSFKVTANFKVSPLEKSPPSGRGKLVLYFTSLRAVRKTYEDCWSVRVILQSYAFRIDERDLWMHGGFRDELNGILGHGYVGSWLPRVFANGRYLGGAEEVMQMHEAGELRKALEDCEVAAAAKRYGGVFCKACGDFRFVPCEICSGSCKVFVEEEDDEVGLFRRCPVCNENGLVRCPLCWC
ncbi:hypothetical protein HPP92_016215 [Vanilla planifolia]|uniref:Glutaredoxin domain-containing protein n=1 Tax=Vanilla planifolia TaxID=51239 RepID=A0A835QBK2_VANPL|nr:hypothetical protein HPP92_016820 [Vanilla planifolia]KAG0471669.1 hypothetical protein HPP92_016215 [Vanilla planifolia]